MMDPAAPIHPPASSNVSIFGKLMGMSDPSKGFGGNLATYFKELVMTPLTFVRRAKVQHTLVVDPGSGHADLSRQKSTADTREMKKEMNWFDLINLGIGIILGAGVFVTTGTVANSYAGGATIISYAIAGLSATLTGLCYCEYAVDYPIAGGSFTFMLMTFGEFPGWIAAVNIVFNYVLANAAISRSFAGYFANLINKDTTFFDVNKAGYDLDFWAFGLVLVLTVPLLFGIRETKQVNNILTVIHVGVVVFIIIAGLTQAKAENFTNGGFAPYGARGVFNGASLLFFSYVGFDAIATTAEEVKNPGRDIPIGMCGALGIVSILYLLCAATLTLMLPYTLISTEAAFSQAFIDVGMKWASYVVAVGAIMGIITSTMVGTLAVSRAICALGREYFIPPMFAWVSRRSQVPLLTTAVVGMVTATIALFTSFDDLLNLVSVCTLFTFWMIANGILFRHYYAPGINKPWFAIFVLTYITGTSLGLAVYYQLKPEGWIGLAIPGALWFVGTFALMFVKPAYTPVRFSVPLMPWIPSGSIILNVFLLSTIAQPTDQGGPGAEPYKQWGVFNAVCVVIYFLYSLPNINIQNRILRMWSAESQDEVDLKHMHGADDLSPKGPAIAAI